MRGKAEELSIRYRDSADPAEQDLAHQAAALWERLKEALALLKDPRRSRYFYLRLRTEDPDYFPPGRAEELSHRLRCALIQLSRVGFHEALTDSLYTRAEWQ